jgi:hypothetical protein
MGFPKSWCGLAANAPVWAPAAASAGPMGEHDAQPMDPDKLVTVTNRQIGDHAAKETT